MRYRIASGVAVTAASAVLTAATLIIAGVSASAADLPTDERSALVSHSVRAADSQDDARLDARLDWVLGQIAWMHDHEGRTDRRDDGHEDRWTHTETDTDHDRTHRSDDGGSHRREGVRWTR